MSRHCGVLAGHRVRRADEQELQNTDGVTDAEAAGSIDIAAHEIGRRGPGGKAEEKASRPDD